MSEKRNILFVDDEPNLLQGLQRSLRPMRREWEMAFSPGGEEALEAMSEKRFDVIVSDMRMPKMSGVALLTEVAREYPEVVRIVLSGESSGEDGAEAAHIAHQYLSKPCDPELLKRTVNRAFALRDLLSDASLKSALSRLKSVPSVPAIHTKLAEELQHPDASLKRIGALISEDPGLTAKTLQMVNSAFFGLPRRVGTPAQAVNLLGTDTIRIIVLSIEVFSTFNNTETDSISPELIQQHSLKTAGFARSIATEEKAAPQMVDASLAAGLLHDIGKLILAQNFPEQYRDVMACVCEDAIPLCDEERKTFGATHAEVGAYLLGLWGLPEPLVEATAFHHNPVKSFGHSFSPLTAVHAANIFAHEWSGQDQATSEHQLDLEYLGDLGIAERVTTWRATCHRVLNEGVTV